MPARPGGCGGARNSSLSTRNSGLFSARPPLVTRNSLSRRPCGVPGISGLTMWDVPVSCVYSGKARVKMMKSRPLVIALVAVLMLSLLPVGPVSAREPGEAIGKYWVLKDRKMGTPSFQGFYPRTSAGWQEEDGVTRWVAGYANSNELTSGFGRFAVGVSDITIDFSERLRSGPDDLVRTEVAGYRSVHVRAALRRAGSRRPGDVSSGWHASRQTASGTTNLRRWRLPLPDEGRDVDIHDELQWTVRFAGVDLLYDYPEVSEMLEFTVPDTEDGRLAITAYSTDYSNAYVTWIFEPGSAEDSNADRILAPGVRVDQVPGIITVIEPGIGIRGKGETEWRPAVDNTAIREGDTIRSAFGGKA